MAIIKYIDKTFRAETLETISTANSIIREYIEAGYRLTLRQLYYQFVARDLIENTQRSYKRIGSIVNDARLAGFMDWAAIEDRTRKTTVWEHWESPRHIVEDCRQWFRTDRWDNQPCRVEVWIEKEALAGVFDRVCSRLDVPFLCCRGYTSQSEMHASAQRMLDTMGAGQRPVILHFGDHDPSGIDMSRDIRDRMRLFGVDFEFDRLALNMDQIAQYKPPPNPAKVTDSRATAYIERFGRKSWELDALEPSVLARLVEDAVMQYRDEDFWQESIEREKSMADKLAQVASDLEADGF